MIPLIFCCYKEINKEMDQTIGICINDGIWEEDGNELAETRKFIR